MQLIASLIFITDGKNQTAPWTCSYFALSHKFVVAWALSLASSEPDKQEGVCVCMSVWGCVRVYVHHRMADNHS